MEVPSPPLRTHRPVATAVLVAAVAVTAFSLVGIASLLGWLPERQKAALVPPEQRTGPDEPAPRAPREVLAPIDAGKRQEPLMPSYSAPQPPKPAPDFVPPAAAPRERVNNAAPSVSPPAPASPAAPAPVTPAYAQAPGAATAPAQPPSLPSAYVGAPRGSAARPGAMSGRVTGLAYRGDAYEVRVRFEDGTSQVFRYRNRPSFEPGDRVRFDGAFLNPD